MNKRLATIVMTGCLILLIAAPGIAKTKAEKQAEARKSAQQTLAKLYQAQPSARATIKAAAGYAAFSNFGMKILLAGGGKGQGIVFDNRTQKVTYMKMREVQAGLGMGVKKFRTIFVFETKGAMDDFVNNGWEFGGQATAAAKSGSKGGSYQGAVQVRTGVWMYQLTDKGLALELTGKGTKYFKDDDLN
ncbi:MAG: YSC84-related protein [Pyrinomonadaceae bacterium]|nr:YSC84-related protein [Pyrinomonadaceae bacterium]